MVAGVTRKATQRSRGMTRLAAARRTRSMAGGDDLLGVGNGCRLSASGISLTTSARWRRRLTRASAPSHDSTAPPGPARCWPARLPSTRPPHPARRQRINAVSGDRGEQPATSAPLRSRWPLVTGVVAHDARTRLTAECPTKTDVSPKCSWREHTDEVSVVDPTTYSCGVQVKAESAQTVPFAALRRSVSESPNSGRTSAAICGASRMASGCW
jgi:hypothetical protein